MYIKSNHKHLKKFILPILSSYNTLKGICFYHITNQRMCQYSGENSAKNATFPHFVPHHIFLTATPINSNIALDFFTKILYNLCNIIDVLCSRK